MQTSITSLWAVKGNKPKVKSYSSKYKVFYSGFVIPFTKQEMETYAGTTITEKLYHY